MPPADVDPDAPRAHSEARDLLAMQLDMLAKHARRYPLPVLVSAAFLALIVWRHVPVAAIAAWVAGLGVILTTRWVYCGRAARIARVEGAPAALRTILLLSIANGVVTGMAVVLFFPRLPLDLKAIFTMVMVCWSAGASSANAAYKPSFYAYTIPILAPLAVVWALDGTFEGIGLALLIAFFQLLQHWLVQYNHEVLMQSFRIRFDRDRLLAQVGEERRKAVEARDRAEQANRSKNVFIAAASHDLKQPLALFSAQAAVLDDPSNPERIRRAGARISDAVEATRVQLNELTDIARLEAGQLVPVDSTFSLAEVAQEALRLDESLWRSKGLETSVAIDPQLMARTDRGLFARILRNLTHNAVKYTAQGSVRVTTRMEGSALVVDVADTGRGIPPELHARIFDPYFRVDGASPDREDGIGLGLDIVRRFSAALEIAVTLVSSPRGSTFSLHIPLDRVTRGSAPAAGAARPRAALPGGLDVLLVDDDAGVRTAQQQSLERLGCRVDVAATTADALAAVRNRRPHVVIADYRLAPGETGVALVERMRDAYGPIPALIVTGDRTEEARRAASAARLPVVDKSADLRTLCDTITAVLSGGT